MWLFVSTVLAADCAETFSTAQMDGLVVKALSKYEAVDVDAFSASIAEIEAALPCMDEAIGSHLAAELHRVRGLSFFLSPDHPEAQASFAAARAIESGYDFPETLVPTGNPVLDDYTAIDPTTLEPSELAPPETGSLRANGGSAVRLGALPMILQWNAPDGSIRSTWLVENGASVPEYPVAKTGGIDLTPEHRVHLNVVMGARYHDFGDQEANSTPATGTVPELSFGLTAAPIKFLAFEVGGNIGYLSSQLEYSPILRAGVRGTYAVGRAEMWLGALGLFALHNEEKPPEVTGGDPESTIVVQSGGGATAGVEIFFVDAVGVQIDVLVGGLADNGLVARGGVGPVVRF